MHTPQKLNQKFTEFVNNNHNNPPTWSKNNNNNTNNTVDFVNNPDYHPLICYDVNNVAHTVTGVWNLHEGRPDSHYDPIKIQRLIRKGREYSISTKLLWQKPVLRLHNNMNNIFLFPYPSILKNYKVRFDVGPPPKLPWVPAFMVHRGVHRRAYAADLNAENLDAKEQLAVITFYSEYDDYRTQLADWNRDLDVAIRLGDLFRAQQTFRKNNPGNANKDDMYRFLHGFHRYDRENRSERQKQRNSSPYSRPDIKSASPAPSTTTFGSPTPMDNVLRHPAPAPLNRSYSSHRSVSAFSPAPPSHYEWSGTDGSIVGDNNVMTPAEDVFFSHLFDQDMDEDTHDPTNSGEGPSGLNKEGRTMFFNDLNILIRHAVLLRTYANNMSAFFSNLLNNARLIMYRSRLNSMNDALSVYFNRTFVVLTLTPLLLAVFRRKIHVACVAAFEMNCFSSVYVTFSLGSPLIGVTTFRLFQFLRNKFKFMLNKTKNLIQFNNCHEIVEVDTFSTNIQSPDSQLPRVFDPKTAEYEPKTVAEPFPGTTVLDRPVKGLNLDQSSPFQTDETRKLNVTFKRKTAPNNIILLDYILTVYNTVTLRFFSNYKLLRETLQKSIKRRGFFPIPLEISASTSNLASSDPLTVYFTYCGVVVTVTAPTTLSPLVKLSTPNYSWPPNQSLETEFLKDLNTTFNIPKSHSIQRPLAVPSQPLSDILTLEQAFFNQLKAKGSKTYNPTLPPTHRNQPPVVQRNDPTPFILRLTRPASPIPDSPEEPARPFAFDPLSPHPTSPVAQVEPQPDPVPTTMTTDNDSSSRSGDRNRVVKMIRPLKGRKLSEVLRWLAHIDSICTRFVGEGKAFKTREEFLENGLNSSHFRKDWEFYDTHVTPGMKFEEFSTIVKQYFCRNVRDSELQEHLDTFKWSKKDSPLAVLSKLCVTNNTLPTDKRLDEYALKKIMLRTCPHKSTKQRIHKGASISVTPATVNGKTSYPWHDNHVTPKDLALYMSDKMGFDDSDSSGDTSSSTDESDSSSSTDTLSESSDSDSSDSSSKSDTDSDQKKKKKKKKSKKKKSKSKKKSPKSKDTKDKSKDKLSDKGKKDTEVLATSDEILKQLKKMDSRLTTIESSGTSSKGASSSGIVDNHQRQPGNTRNVSRIPPFTRLSGYNRHSNREDLQTMLSDVLNAHDGQLVEDNQPPMTEREVYTFVSHVGFNQDPRQHRTGFPTPSPPGQRDPSPGRACYICRGDHISVHCPYKDVVAEYIKSLPKPSGMSPNIHELNENDLTSYFSTTQPSQVLNDDSVDDFLRFFTSFSPDTSMFVGVPMTLVSSLSSIFASSSLFSSFLRCDHLTTLLDIVPSASVVSNHAWITLTRHVFVFIPVGVEIKVLRFLINCGIRCTAVVTSNAHEQWWNAFYDLSLSAPIPIYGSPPFWFSTQNGTLLPSLFAFDLDCNLMRLHAQRYSRPLPRHLISLRAQLQSDGSVQFIPEYPKVLKRVECPQPAAQLNETRQTPPTTLVSTFKEREAAYNQAKKRLGLETHVSIKTGESEHGNVQKHSEQSPTETLPPIQNVKTSKQIWKPSQENTCINDSDVDSNVETSNEEIYDAQPVKRVSFAEFVECQDAKETVSKELLKTNYGPTIVHIPVWQQLDSKHFTDVTIQWKPIRYRKRPHENKKPPKKAVKTKKQDNEIKDSKKDATPVNETEKPTTLVTEEKTQSTSTTEENDNYAPFEDPEGSTIALVNGYVGGKKVEEMLLDTGSNHGVVDVEYLKTLPHAPKVIPTRDKRYNVGVGGRSLILGHVFLSLAIGNDPTKRKMCKFSVVTGCPRLIIVGTPQLRSFKVDILYSKDIVTFQYNTSGCETKTYSTPLKTTIFAPPAYDRVLHLCLDQDIILQPGESTYVKVKLSHPLHSRLSTYIIEPLLSVIDSGILAARALVTGDQLMTRGCVRNTLTLPIAYKGLKPLYLPARTKLWSISDSSHAEVLHSVEVPRSKIYDQEYINDLMMFVQAVELDKVTDDPTTLHCEFDKWRENVSTADKQDDLNPQETTDLSENTSVTSDSFEKDEEPVVTNLFSKLNRDPIPNLELASDTEDNDTSMTFTTTDDADNPLSGI
ncbi:hypothetical protein HDU76_004491, partial [Blyttiomyces sp. JEL0837]